MSPISPRSCLHTSRADELTQEEGSTAYIRTRLINWWEQRSINYLPHPCGLVHWANLWGRPQHWRMKRACVTADSTKSPPAFAYSLNLVLKLGNSFDCTCGKLSRIFSSATFNSKTVVIFELSKSFVWCRNCWATRAVRTQPRASRWICRSV